MGRMTGSWLDGPGAALRADADPQMYPGRRLGLPQTGRGSVAGFGRRLAALVVDWLLCQFAAAAITGQAAFATDHPVHPLWPLLIFGLEYVVLLSLIGRTIGMRLLGIGVVRLDGGRLEPGWVVVRTVLLLLVVPAVVYDRDHRGLHDKAAGAVAVRL